MNVILNFAVFNIFIFSSVLCKELGPMGRRDYGICYPVCPMSDNTACGFNGECYKFFAHRCDLKNMNNCKNNNYNGPSE